MFKRMLSVFLCIATVFILLACEINDTIDISSTSSEVTSNTITSTENTSSTTVSAVEYGGPLSESVVSSWLAERTEITDINSGDYDDIVTQIYPFDTVYKYDFYNCLNFLGSRIYSLMAEDFDFECYRKASDNAIYSIMKLEDGTLIYAFFAAVGKNLNGSFWEAYGTAASKKLSSADFESIAVGSSLDSVAEIEPAADTIIKSITFDFRDVYDSISTRLILTDGLLELEYASDENGEYFVTKKELHEDFKCVYVVSSDTAYILDFSILEKDYPKN